MTTFTLKGQAGTRKVWLNGKPLDPARSQKIWNHSPDGFNWGYGGSGPAQLALSILLELLPEEQALKHYSDLRANIISGLTMDKSFHRKITLDLTGDVYNCVMNLTI